MRSKLILGVAALVVAALGLAGCAPASHTTSQAASASPSPTTACDPRATPPPPPDRPERTVTVGTIPRTFLLHVPDDYTSKRPVPLILAFHGHGSSPEQLEEFSGLDESDAIVAYPQGTVYDGQAAWQSAPYADGADDVSFAQELIEMLTHQYCVRGVFATGISNGGGLVSLLMCALPDTIDAFAVVAGAVYPASAPCRRTQPVPVIEFHGTADPVIDYNGGMSHGAAYSSTPDWLAKTAQVNGCTGQEQASIPPDVSRTTWTGCAPGGDVVAYAIEGGGHTWPGAAKPSGPGAVTQTISATDLMLAFFTGYAGRVPQP
ncbi:PHB depolymerase family esterase [Microbacterium sp. SORGH_AS_0888]|uniref:alpha/beta hydrolase family esterase n=1 Tax=Microbacterium sp. SORGH_AS_0888 TaxID=3041791 RepID=UPI0027854C23|nr:alpha/beta hydrolase-fold protein [Microbacterium sp. SORGH_AS_0888]MDQ1130472.1 polyhydroxybutyrate depolymerase [Microbacterium sp. SORGH_AS_0888]